MNSDLDELKLNYRKLKISDYYQFKRLFKYSFNKEISYDFYKWRYFKDKYSFCYGAFKSSTLIANVGMFSVKLNNNKGEKIFSRHSSMVLKKYRFKGVFSRLLNRVKKNFLKKTYLVVMWPNKNNFANFGLNSDKIIKKKFYLYKTISKSNTLNTEKLKNIDELNNLKYYINQKKSFFYKDFNYFKNRYFLYRKSDYYINKFKFKNFESFFILKFQKESSRNYLVILDHFGSEKIINKHLSSIIKSQKKIIFLSQKKIINSNIKLLNNIYLKVGFIKKYTKIKKKNILKKQIFLGDTDIFITT